MSDFLTEVLAAIPTAASSPMALVAYLAALIIWGIIAFRVRTLSSIQNSIQNLPEKDRIESLRSALGDVPVQKFTAEEYLKLRRQRYIFFGILALCFTGVVTVSMAVKEALDKEKLTNQLIEDVLEPPSSQYMSAFNLLDNSPGSVEVLSQTLQPELTPQELDAVVMELQSRGYDFDQIKRILAERSSGGQLQDLNQMAKNAVARLNGSFTNLTDCFREQRCVSSAEKMANLCAQIVPIASNIRSVNEAALSIPGVTFVESGSTALFGDGIMNRVFEELDAQNVDFLKRECA